LAAAERADPKEQSAQTLIDDWQERRPIPSRELSRLALSFCSANV
jgi:hypothetical protein